MAASCRTSAPVAACGILLALGAPDSYNFIYSRFPFNGWIGVFFCEVRPTVISRQRMFCWSGGVSRQQPIGRALQSGFWAQPNRHVQLGKTLQDRVLSVTEFP